MKCLDGIKLIKNWFAVGLFMAGFYKTVTMKFRDGFEVSLNTNNDFYSFWETKEGIKQKLSLNKFKKVKIDEYNHNIAISIGGYPLIKFYYAEAKEVLNIVSLINLLFEKGEYRSVYVKDRIIIDIGAYIGDTAIYFVYKGCKAVYALEPFPYSFKIANINIALNKCDDKITLLNAGIGKKSGTIKINSEYISGVDSSIDSLINPNIHFDNGELKTVHGNNKTMINIITLQEIINRYNLKNQPCVLKMNCEGCEYETILNTPDSVLKEFEQIVIEYHYGYINIKNKLESIGFKVKISTKRFRTRKDLTQAY
ncbi:MAG: FkbM family methyltransferase [bacterium]